MAIISHIPQHVAIIMDGNGRWAKERGLSRLEGHKAGTENIRRVIDTFVRYGVKYLTLYAFSTENWNRPKSEVSGLFRLLGQVIKSESQALHERGVHIRHLGTLNGLSPRLIHQVQQAIELTRNNTNITLSLAFNYGGRAEILEAVRHMVANGIDPEKIDEKVFGNYLYTQGLPDPDLIIRTGGELRLSNFLLWQAAYSEYYATPTYWPDVNESDIEKALLAYSQRQRRFGGLRPDLMLQGNGSA